MAKIWQKKKIKTPKKNKNNENIYRGKLTKKNDQDFADEGIKEEEESLKVTQKE